MPPCIKGWFSVFLFPLKSKSCSYLYVKTFSFLFKPFPRLHHNTSPYVFMDLDNITEPMEFDSRSAADSGIPNTIDKEDNVELEKSNVLLMGPTGSGIIPSKAL